MKVQLLTSCGWLAFMTLTAVGPAVAQDARRPAPADSRPAEPAGKLTSAFTDYKPFSEQPPRSWKEANQEVADNPGMGSMTNMPGMAGMAGTPGMDAKPGAAPKGKAGAGGHDMASMPGMDAKPGAAPRGKAGAGGHDMAAMPGMDAKPGAAPKGKAGAGGHDMAGMPGMDAKPGAAPKGKASAGGHDMAAMPGMDAKPGAAPQGKPAGGGHHGTASMPGMAAKPGEPQNARIAGTGVVRAVDRANGKVKITHDPIEAMGWPRMTLVFRLKEGLPTDRVKEGDKVAFSLQKSAAGYVISDIRKPAEAQDAKHVR